LTTLSKAPRGRLSGKLGIYKRVKGGIRLFKNRGTSRLHGFTKWYPISGG